MINYRIMTALINIIFLLSLFACTQDGSAGKEPVFKKDYEMEEIKPSAPAKIKLKRNSQGDYSWDISGTDADSIIEEDGKLKEYLEKQ